MGVVAHCWSDPRPITSADVSMLTTINGVDPNVLDGHLWAFLNLNLTGQAEEVFNNVTVMQGLEVWRRIVAQLIALTGLRQLVTGL